MDAKWEKRFLDMATLVSSWSKQEKKVGAVAVTAERKVAGVGYNGPKPCYNDELLTEENSTDIVVHAEVNVLENSFGTDLTMFVTLHPCAKCARRIVESGRVIRVVTPPPIDTGRWAESQREAIDILTDNRIEIDYYVRRRT